MLSYCNTPQCKICTLQLLDVNPDFYSNLSIKKHTFSNDGSCKSKNCVYLISCKAPRCHMKYVGFTTTPLHKRLSGHRSNIANGTEGHVMLQHFTKIHRVTDIIIKPIEYCDGKFIRSKEKFWIQELNTIFPYGLNNRIDLEGITDAYQHMKNDSDIPIYTLFNLVKNNRTSRGSGINIIHRVDTFDPGKFIENIINNAGVSISKESRKQIMALQAIFINDLLIYVTKLITEYDNNYEFNEYFLYIVKDLCLYRLFKLKIKNTKKHNNYIILYYANKLIDNINLGKIIHSAYSYNCFPADKAYITDTGIAYKYSPTIRNKVTNYKDTVNSNNDNVQYLCHSFPVYVDNQYGHVITGNLNIIQNIELRTLLSKGLNFRERYAYDIDKAFSSVISAIDSFIFQISNSSKVPIKSFSPWKKVLLNKVKWILDHSKKFPTHSILNSQYNLQSLKDLQCNFVFTPVDKASNNIGIICKYFYLKVLADEILHSGNFQYNNFNKDNIINNYSLLLKSSGSNSNISKDMPFVYWIPKFHKEPIEPRFITSGRHTSANELSKLLGIGLKSLLNAQRTRSKFQHNYDGIRDFYIIDDNKPVIQFMKESNLKNNYKNVKTYDFKTLYTKIPHGKLKDNIKKFVESVFQFKDKRFLNIRSKSATFSDNKNKNGSFSSVDFLTYVNFLVDNCFVLYRDQVFQQIIGIPMGSNCASHLANIFLHVYERSFVQELISNNNFDHIHNSGAIFRYQDDLINFENYNVHNDDIIKMYPKEMVIKNTNVYANKVTYLDLDITINNNIYTYKLYDKRNDFSFPIIKYPDLAGNIPINPAFGVFTSQLIRFSKLNKEANDFQENVISLVDTLVKQGFNVKALKAKYVHFAKNKIVHWAHFGVNILEPDYILAIFR